MKRTAAAWAWVGLAAAGLALAGCGGNDSSNSADLRVLNATNHHAVIDLLVGGAVVEAATATDALSAYASTASGTDTLEINDSAAGSAALTTTAAALAGGGHYTLIAYEAGSSVKTAVLQEDNAAPTAGSAQMRLFNTVTDAGKLDAYVANVADCGSGTLAALSPLTTFTSNTAVTSTGLATYSPGSYRVCITGAGNSADLRMELPLALTDGQVAFVVLTPTTGGTLLNGSVLTQQGGDVATRNTNARVRLASAVAGGATVSANATASGSATTVIDAGSLAPAFGYYVLVPGAAGSSLNIGITSSAFSGSVAAPPTPLAAGGDYTLLVYGAAASPAATLLVDDNRPPSDGASVKLRLINGITGSTGALTLTDNSALVANGVAPGTASGYVAVTANASTGAATLKLTSSAVAGTLLTDVDDPLNVNTVHTLMAAGDVAAPQFLIH